jgi:dTDP-4-dehydrorhamnose reductase
LGGKQVKVLITGSKGQLGIELARQLSLVNPDFEVIKTDLHNLDITDQVQVFSLMEARKPDVVINCAAYTNVDRCEMDEPNAFRANAIGAQNLSVGACKLGARMVQVSTDYVFDGTGSTPRKEYDSINPQSCYGTTKALVEKLVKETNPRHYIVRTAWLYGEGSNFVRTMLRLAGERKEIDVVGDQIGSPTSTVDLANCILKLLQTESYGTYHATCEGSCSWYDFSKMIFKLRQIEIPINKITTEQLNRLAKRPQYSVLDNYMLKILGLNMFRPWEEALEAFLREEKMA